MLWDFGFGKIFNTYLKIFILLLVFRIFQLEIFIIDTNNKNPNPLTNEFNTTLYIYENASTNYEIVKIKAEDLDRDGIL